MRTNVNWYHCVQTRLRTFTIVYRHKCVQTQMRTDKIAYIHNCVQMRTGTIAYTVTIVYRHKCAQTQMRTDTIAYRHNCVYSHNCVQTQMRTDTDNSRWDFPCPINSNRFHHMERSDPNLIKVRCPTHTEKLTLRKADVWCLLPQKGFFRLCLQVYNSRPTTTPVPAAAATAAEGRHGNCLPTRQDTAHKQHLFKMKMNNY